MLLRHLDLAKNFVEISKDPGHILLINLDLNGERTTVSTRAGAGAGGTKSGKTLDLHSRRQIDGHTQFPGKLLAR